jgi:hypothetical protein
MEKEQKEAAEKAAIEESNANAKKTDGRDPVGDPGSVTA